jgi:hypothetical protein
METPIIRIYSDNIEGQEILEVFFNSKNGEQMNAKAVFIKNQLTSELCIEMFRKLADGIEKGL